MLYKKISELPSGIVAQDDDLIEISRQLTDAKKSYSLKISAVTDLTTSKIKPSLDDKISGSVFDNPDTNDGVGIGLHWQGNGGKNNDGLPNFQYYLMSDGNKTPVFTNLITKPYFEKYTANFVTKDNIPQPDLKEYVSGRKYIVTDQNDGYGISLSYNKLLECSRFNYELSVSGAADYDLFVSGKRVSNDGLHVSKMFANNKQEVFARLVDESGKKTDKKLVTSDSLNTDNLITTDVNNGLHPGQAQAKAKVSDIISGFEIINGKNTQRLYVTTYLSNGKDVNITIPTFTDLIASDYGDGWERTGRKTRNFGTITFPEDNKKISDSILVTFAKPLRVVYTASAINGSSTTQVDFLAGIHVNDDKKTAYVAGRNVANGHMGGSFFYWEVSGEE